ncbi:MAG: tannase/feruloyl esterase family alpha/beta hydrolase [Candidatus Acidiferrales bacterium]
MNLRARFIVIATAAALLFLFARPAAAKTCEDLAKLTFPQASVTIAQRLPAGSFAPPNTRALADLPAFCRIAATIKPTPVSDIKIEVWLPLTSWNGKFEAVGNGGWAGAIEYSALADALRHGFATSSTDDGDAGDLSLFVAHPERFVDFAYRSEHEMTLRAKAFIAAFYGRAPRYSYWNGCSGGGREALLQAYRYPDDFNGIVAGDPATFRRNAWAMHIANAAFKNPADYIPPAKYPMIHQAVLNACDKLDGLQDGLITDPRSCHFDPETLLCKGADASNCLTQSQVQTARTILSPMKSVTGKELFPRLEPGTELRWGRLAGGPEPADLFLDYFRFIVFENPAWDWRTFETDRDTALADQDAEGIIALNPDLSAYARHAGKLLIYHGWADQQVAPVATIEFYEAMAAAEAESAGSTSANIDDWARLFMAPGMAHCSGGEGPNQFDKMEVIQQWVENGKPPVQIVAAHVSNGQVDRTRPLCPYPQAAEYKGSGSIDQAETFACKMIQH